MPIASLRTSVRWWGSSSTVLWSDCGDMKLLTIDSQFDFYKFRPAAQPPPAPSRSDFCHKTFLNMESEVKASLPIPTYLPVDPANSPLIPKHLSTIQAAEKTLVEKKTIPIRRALAWEVKAGQVFRLTTPNGPQVGDLNIWNLHNPRERFWASRTRQLHATHVTTGHRLWSCLPYLRPLVTIVGDSVGGLKYGGGGDGKDKFGGRCHDLLGTRCDPYVGSLLNGGQSFDFACHSNLTRAVLPWGLQEQDVHDVLNVFQVTGLDQAGRYWMGTSPSGPSDYIEFFAEVDVLVALSACPGGDLSKYTWDGQDNMLETCRPLGVEIYDIVNKDEVLKDWTAPKPPEYMGLHGLQLPSAQ